MNSLARWLIGITLTGAKCVPKLILVAVKLKPETESRIHELAAKTGRAPEDLVEDAMSAYLAELVQVRETLDNRYDQVKNGSVQPLDGEKAFAELRKKNANRSHS